ncbi:hypothetical protein ACT434_08405 [Acinetobacter baumannii]
MQKLDTIDNLIDQILKEEKDINSMNLEELKKLRNLVKNEDNNLNCIVEKALVPLTNMNSNPINEPYWFINNTKYEDNTWYIKLGKNTKIIDFSRIMLSDNIFLAEDNELLNTFKTWILIQGCPKYNKGLNLTNITISQSINKVLLLLDNIITNSEKINLIERKAYALDSDFFKDILISICRKGAINTTYNSIVNFEKFLSERIKDIKVEELEDFESNFPLVKENYDINNLNFSLDQIRKSRYWLFKNNAYSSKNNYSILPTFDFNKIDNRTYLNLKNIHIKKMTELSLFSDTTDTEYPLIPCRNNSEISSTSRTIFSYVDVIKKLVYVNAFDFCSPVNTKSLADLSGNFISNHINLLEIGRYKSIPSKVILNSIKNGFDFIFKYMDSILESIFSVSCIGCRPYQHGLKYNNWKILKENTWKSQISPDLLKLGINYWNIKVSEKDCFKLRRQNAGFCDLYNVLMGSIQIVIGAITARRQSELVELHPTNCLVPANIDPLNNKDIEFELIFDNRKSGVGGLVPIRESLSRPIPNSIATIIYKLQKLNERILSFHNMKISDLSLINSYSSHQNKFLKITAKSYNMHLNAFCDYFETPTLASNSNITKRYYIRQHQLRRFFALLFFWSKSYDGLDTLRHFLGHTNPEHLYNYITESITGEVLSGVKAQALVEQISGSGQAKVFTKNIEYLSPILEKYFGVREFEILSESDIFKLYSSNEISRHLKNYSVIEQQILYLIDNHIIDLEPEFFSIRNYDGEIVRDFNLILRIKDEI